MIAGSLRRLIGARFQNVFTDETGVAFEVYEGGSTRWLWLFMNPTLPLILFGDPPKAKSKTTPFALFFRANVLGKRLRLLENTGRILKFHLGELEDNVTLEVRLFPHGQNLICIAGKKKISWEKMKELKPEKGFQTENIRTWDEIHKEYEQTLNKPKQSTVESEIEKRKRALLKTKENLGPNLWKNVGEWLKENQSVEVPVEYQKYVNRKLSLSKNIENCFAKSKQFDRKHAGTLARIEQLEGEIKKLMSGDFQPKNQNKVKIIESFRGIRVELDGNMVGYIGKSAKDNIDLLRQSKAWYYWVHLRDYPGAHGFIVRNKNQNVPVDCIKKVAQKIAERSKVTAGESFDVIVAECCYVKPIKRDKLGRVTFSNETIHTFKN